MNFWTTKTFSVEESQACDDVTNLVEALFKAVGSPRHMTLISSEDDAGTQLYLELPHVAMLSVFPGFERIDSQSMPKVGNLLVGFVDRFERQFRYQPVSAL